jgi:chaperonin cofactor prefoldin
MRYRITRAVWARKKFEMDTGLGKGSIFTAFCHTTPPLSFFASRFYFSHLFSCSKSLKRLCCMGIFTDAPFRWNACRLVLDTLQPLPQDRKCFRMINGVLVERTVKEVVPALETNSEGLKKLLAELVSQYKSKEAEMEKWKVGMIVLQPDSLSNLGMQKKNNVQVVQQ